MPAVDPAHIESVSPFLVWLTMATTSLVSLAAAMPKIFGPVGDALEKWMDQHRRISEAKDAGVEEGLREDRDYWRAEAGDRLRSLVARDHLAQQHYRWDYARVEEAAARGVPVPPPPPLVPIEAEEMHDG